MLLQISKYLRVEFVWRDCEINLAPSSPI
uniref:Uncharacterized protein n=1 Tax=Arcella intermedia TaxID=1963864 RepID=A0A6B2LXA8_9EUKA